jgi:Ca-activated chloride channel family protein
MEVTVRLSVLVTLVGLLTGGGLAHARPASGQQPVFRASVDRVAVATIVRTKNGRPVTDLKQEDFQIFDSGVRRPIAEFRAEQTPVSLAMLVDFSGSMDVADKRETAQQIAGHIVSWLTPGEDRIGLYSFDRDLQEVSPLRAAPSDVLQKLQTIKPYGVTSLFDAIAKTGRMLAEHEGPRRAVVVLTDGVDNASALTAAEVSGIASSIDVPVYIVIVVSPLDRSGKSTIDDTRLDAMLEGRLADLAHWTGGEIFAGMGPAQDSLAARQIVTELRQQYMLVFQPDTKPGWHPIDIRTRQKDLVVRARSGYLVQGQPERR